MEKVLVAESEDQLGAWQGGCEGPSSSHDDPYADASIDFGSRPALPVYQRESKRLVMKRKVLRHRPDGRVEVSDESLNMEPDSNVEPWSLGYCRTSVDDTISEGEIEASSGTLEDYLHYDEDDDDWLVEDSPCSHLGDFGSDTISEYAFPGRRPTGSSVPQAERRKRTDRVARFNQYKRDWARFCFPGQDSHQDLRWAMRKQMLQSGLPRRAQKRMVPNTYVVPTMKKRDSLRSGVHWDLAHCVMPRRNTSS